jgi:hypothetical protein
MKKLWKVALVLAIAAASLTSGPRNASADIHCNLCVMDRSRCMDCCRCAGYTMSECLAICF